MKAIMPKIFILLACEECHHCLKKTVTLGFGKKMDWCIEYEREIPDIGEIAEFCELDDAEENNKLRAKWFEKGQLSVKRKNESGCICIINDAYEVVSPCLAHKAWMEEQCQKN